MGLAILPARLKAEMEELTEMILAEDSFANHPNLEKHEAWFNAFKDEYTFNAENTRDILLGEVGKTFVKVLEDAGVYKVTEKGRNDFLKFVSYVNK